MDNYTVGSEGTLFTNKGVEIGLKWNKHNDIWA